MKGGEACPRLWARRAALLAVVAWGLFSVAARAGLSDDEPFPALIGPDFGPVLWSGGSVLTEGVSIAAELSPGEVVKLPARRWLRQFPAPGRFVVRRWMEARPFDSEGGRRWLNERLKGAKLPGAARSVVLQWTQRPCDPSTRRWTGPPRVVRQTEFSL